MDFISLVLIAINGVRTVLSNPALGGGSSVKMGEASELLGLLGMLIEEGDDAYDDLKAFTETIQSMADQGRAPSPDEWAGIRLRSDDAHARLQAVKEELLAPAGEETPPAPEQPTEPEEAATVAGENLPDPADPEAVPV